MTLSRSHHVVENNTDKRISHHVIDSKGDNLERRTKRSDIGDRVSSGAGSQPLRMLSSSPLAKQPGCCRPRRNGWRRWPTWKRPRPRPRRRSTHQSTVNSAPSTEPFRVTRLILGGGKKGKTLSL